MKFFVSGKIVDEKRAKLSISDRGFLYGDGLFETMRAYEGRVFKLEEHLRRLYDSAKIISLKISLSRDELKKTIYQLLRLNKLKDAYIRLAVSRGEGRVGLNANTAKSSSAVIITKKFNPYPERLYKNGLSAAISSVRRNEDSVLSRIKSSNYLNNIIARIEVQKKGFDDAVVLNNGGEVACGAVSNIFIVNKDNLLTPHRESGILLGITRKVIINEAPKAGFKVKEAFIKPRALYSAEEVFFTNTLMEVMPVTSVDGKKIRSGKVGEAARAIHDLLKRQIRAISL